MEKCLVTKLGASVSGDFPKLGELVIPINTIDLNQEPTANDYIRFYYANNYFDYVAELRGGLQFAGGDSPTAAGDTKLKAAKKGYLKPNQEGSIVILKKYDLTRFEIADTANTGNFLTKIDIKELSYSKDMMVLTITRNRAKGDIACFANIAFTSCRLDGNAEVGGNITAFAYTYAQAAKNNTSISNFSLRGNPLVEGSIESLVVAIRALQAAAGEEETSGANKFGANFSGTQVTFNGGVMASDIGYKLSWTATTITITDKNNNETTITA